MYFCLVVALVSTFYWINIMFSEIISAKINLFATGDTNDDKLKAKMKNILIVIMALFWGAVILYW